MIFKHLLSQFYHKKFIERFDHKFHTVPYLASKPLPEVNMGFERN